MAERELDPVMTRFLMKGQKEAGNSCAAKLIVAPGKIEVVPYNNNYPTILLKTTDVVKPKPPKGNTSWIVLDVADADNEFVSISITPLDASKMTVLLDLISHACSGPRPGLNVPTKALGEVLHEYIFTGRKLPTEKEPVTPIYKMNILASNTVIAESRFWYFVSKLHGLKKANGEILECKETGYRVYRDVSVAGAVTQVETIEAADA